MAHIIDRIFDRIHLLETTDQPRAEKRLVALNELLVKKGVTRLTSRSWIYFKPNVIKCSQAQFDEFWDLCPEVRHQIKMFGKLVEIPRFQKLYGDASYKFSGVEMQPDPEIPELVKRCLEYARKHWSQKADGTPLNWNGALVNWYPDGRSYIGPHSDDERDLVPGVPILSFSFGSIRSFRIKYKKASIAPTMVVLDSNGQPIIPEKKFPTLDCSLIAMGGLMQQEYKHEIMKTTTPVGPRINITIRCFG